MALSCLKKAQKYASENYNIFKYIGFSCYQKFTAGLSYTSFMHNREVVELAQEKSDIFETETGDIFHNISIICYRTSKDININHSTFKRTHIKRVNTNSVQEKERINTKFES